MTSYFTTSEKRKSRRVLLIAACAVILLIGWMHGPVVWAKSEEKEVTAYIMMKPGDCVNLRMTPSRKGREVGLLEPCDSFTTDGRVTNGFLHVLDRGDCDCWVYAGYVTFEEPVAVMEHYIVCSNGRVACRRWMDGELVARHPWAVNGSELTVFYMADGWACTSRGYLKAEFLEVDPQ